jgi:hypothetical protein
MSFLAFVVFLAAIWSIRNLVLATLAYRDRRRIAHHIRVFRTQSNFAEARTDLMRLAVNGEIDVRSATFRQVYHLTTAIMRRPDEYPTISAALRKAFLNSMEQGVRSELHQERETWTQGVKVMLLKMSKSLDYIIFNHSIWWRVAIRHRRWMRPFVLFLVRRLRWLANTLNARARKDPIVSDIKATQQYIHALTAPA